MPRIAIAGNIASGKSVVEKILTNKGFQVYDTDKIAHDILKNSFEARETFPQTVVNGEVDRKKLAKIVFSDKEKLRELENIIHPKVREFILNINSEKPVFISVPLVFEAGFEDLFDKIIFISAPIEIRLKRLMERNNLTQEEALTRINAQLGENDKITKCDFVIKNTGSKDDLEKNITELLKKNKYLPD